MQQDIQKEVKDQVRLIQEHHKKQLEILTRERDRLLAGYKKNLETQSKENHA